MDVREKLVELISQIQSYGVKQGSHITHQEGKTNREIASHLIANGVTVQEWISVKDRLPDMYQNVLAIRADGKIVVDAIGSLEIWYKQMDIVGRPVTHWMPLPEPPEELKEIKCYNCNGTDEPEHYQNKKYCPNCGTRVD